MSAPDEEEPGFRYKVDRAAQGFGPLRAMDAYGLRHPVVNALCLVITGVFFAVVLSFAWHSWPDGTAAGVVIAVAALFATRANHRRRLKNGTSAAYGPPRDRT